jgi:hypothetical protein
MFLALYIQNQAREEGGKLAHVNQMGRSSMFIYMVHLMPDMNKEL